MPVPMPTRRRFLLGLAAVTASACGPPDDGGNLAAFAASSLADVLGPLGRGFAASGGSNVTPVFAGSQILRLQIEQGAPADVFLSADGTHVDHLERLGLVAHRTPFATNEVVVAVSAESAILDLRALPAARRILLGTPQVPVGAAARRLLAGLEARFGPSFGASVRGAVVSLEPSARLLRAKLEAGEADAAFLYRTDLHDRPRLRALSPPTDLRTTTTLHAAALATAPHPRSARAFVSYLLAPPAQAVLAAHGFGPPPRT